MLYSLHKNQAVLKSIKYITIAVIFIGIFYFAYLQDCIADTVSIKSTMKVYRMGGYVILINYETHDKWTDGLLFKVCCKFNGGEFIFTSSSLNNVEKGWHKTEIAISEVMKKRYGYLQGYKVELYRNGALTDEKEY